MRKFAISDIHGSYEEMMCLLEYVSFDSAVDQLVVIGDMIDRGPDSGKVLKELFERQKTGKNIHVLAGNHEEMFLWYIDEIDPMWMMYGGVQAAKSMNHVFEDVSSIVEWIRQLPLIFEDESFVYAHAGISIPYPNDIIDRSGLWLEKEDFYDIKKESLLHYTKNKPVVHGHTPNNVVTCDQARISIDLGAQCSDEPKLALVELTSKHYYEYDFESKYITKKTIQDIS